MAMIYVIVVLLLMMVMVMMVRAGAFGQVAFGQAASWTMSAPAPPLVFGAAPGTAAAAGGGSPGFMFGGGSTEMES